MDEEELQKVFGHNFRALRMARGLTRKAFGAAIGGFGEAYIGAIERGDRNLRLQTVVYLSRLAGADPYELLQRPSDWSVVRAAADGVEPAPITRRPATGAARRRRPAPPAPT